MRVQSIGTTIKPGDPARDRFFCPTGEVPFRKMHCIAEAHDVAQEIRAVAEAFQNAGHLLTARVGAPFVVYLRNLTSGVGILDDFDLGLRVWHARRLAYLLALGACYGRPAAICCSSDARVASNSGSTVRKSKSTWSSCMRPTTGGSSRRSAKRSAWGGSIW